MRVINAAIDALKRSARRRRLLKTPTCDKCAHFKADDDTDGYGGMCQCDEYLEYVNRLEGTSRTWAWNNCVRGTRQCRFKPIEEETDE